MNYDRLASHLVPRQFLGPSAADQHFSGVERLLGGQIDHSVQGLAGCDHWLLELELDLSLWRGGMLATAH